MKVLELFAGSRSFSKVAEELGHQCYTTDIEPFDKIDQVCNIFNFDVNRMIDEFGYPDVIWASPPCTTFSVASIGHHYTGGKKAYIPKTKEAKIGIKIVEYTIKLISMLNPLPVIEDKAKKSPLCAFSIVIPIDGKTELAETLVPD